MVQHAIEWDKEDNHNKLPSKKKKDHIDLLVKTTNSCGVCFQVWEKRNADGKGSGIYESTSLMGSDKKKLLEVLPEKMSQQDIVKPDMRDAIINLWKVTYVLMYLSMCSCTKK